MQKDWSQDEVSMVQQWFVGQLTPVWMAGWAPHNSRGACTIHVQPKPAMTFMTSNNMLSSKRCLKPLAAISNDELRFLGGSLGLSMVEHVSSGLGKGEIKGHRRSKGVRAEHGNGL